MRCFNIAVALILVMSATFQLIDCIDAKTFQSKIMYQEVLNYEQGHINFLRRPKTWIVKVIKQHIKKA